MLPIALTLISLLPQDREVVDGAAAMDRARAALGRSEALERVKTRRYSGKASWVNLALGPGTFEEVFGGPNKAFLLSEFEGFGQFTLGAIDGLVWEKPPGSIQVKRGWVACADLRQYGILQHQPWREMYASAKLVGTDDVGTRLELIPKPQIAVPKDSEPPADVLWLDPQTHLARRLEVYMLNESGAKVRRVGIDYAEWKSVDGIRYPHRRMLEVQGFTLRLDYTSIEHDPELAQGVFEPGDEVRAEAAQLPEVGKPVQVPEIEVQELEAVHTAFIRVKSKPTDLQKTFTVIFPEAWQKANAAGAGPGTVFARFHDQGPDEFDLEGGVVVEKPFTDSGRVKGGTLPAGLTVVAWHVGPYHKLSETHARVQAWMAEKEYEGNGPPWEEYVTDPGLEPDESKLRTRVCWPVKQRADK